MPARKRKIGRRKSSIFPKKILLKLKQVDILNHLKSHKKVFRHINLVSLKTIFSNFNKKKIIHFYKKVKKIKLSTIPKKIEFLVKEFAFFLKWRNLKTLTKKIYTSIKNFSRDLTPAFVGKAVRRHLPLFLAIVFLTPSVILLGIFVYSKLNRPPAFAAPFTGKVKVSKETTTLSTNGGWYTAVAYSGDGINGDAESGTLNPIHPGGTSEGGSGSGLAIGYLTAAATTYATAEFIGFKPSVSANLNGVMLVLDNTSLTSRCDVDIVVELLYFPSATCGPSSCSNYVTGSLNSFTYPNDTVVLRRTVWQFNQGLSGENLVPGSSGRATFDFRFDPPVAVTAGSHYGIRIINMGSGAPVFGTWAANAPFGDFPTVNGTFRTIGVEGIDNTNAPTMNMPLALSGNSVIILGTSPTQSSGMVAGNSAAGIGMPTVRRTENEHWTATYSSASGNWTIVGSVSGTQSRKLTTVTTGGTGPSWVNDGVPMTTLTANSTASTRLCVDSISGFAPNQIINLWDSDTATAAYTIASVNSSDSNCPNSGPSIITTLASVAGYTVDKNATVAQAIWKQRIIQGAIQPFTQNMPTTTKICVADASQFSVRVGSAANIAVWDNNSAILATNAITAITIDDPACTNPSDDSLTLASAITAGTYTIDQNAMVAEISATLSNKGTPNNGALMRWTSFNHTQNPTNSSFLDRVSSVVIGLAKNLSPTQSGTNYPFLSNYHMFFVAYGDNDTTAPSDGDFVIVGNGKADPDSNDSPNLNSDLNWASKQTHVVTVDRNWDAALVYTGSYGGAVLDGAGSRADFSAYSQNAGWISALISPGSQLLFGNAPNTHYRITIPGKIIVDSDASLAFGKQGASIPASSFHDIYFDNVSPAVSTLLTSNTDTGTLLNVVSTSGFNVGDTIIIRDNDTPAITRLIAAIESATQIRVTAALVADYTTSQGAYVAKGPTTELPTGADRRAGIYTMTGLVATSQRNNRTGRVSLYAQGSDNFRINKSDLAVDVEGDIDTGFLGNNLTDAGNTWLDVKDNVVGNWQPLDNIAVAGGTNQLADNEFSSIRMAGNDDANQMPVWTGLQNVGGRNALPTPNMEIAEIGTIPMTDIYNADWNGGSPLFSSNYNNSSSWTIFGDGANTEVNDAVYFGDQGNNMFYSLEFNIGTAMVANVSYVWEYWNGTSWQSFNPRDAYKYEPRPDYCLPLSVDTVRNSYTLTVATGGTNFGLDQIVAISDNDSPTIYARLGTSAPTATTLTFTEPLPAGYTVSQNAKVCRLNGGRWIAFDPANIFNSGTGRRILSWTPSNLNGTPAKRTVNNVNAYWVRARIASFTSWTTSPVNQNTPVGMSGLERVSSGHITLSSGVQEAKITEITPGPSYDPNERWILEYGNSPGWVEVIRGASIGVLSAPYLYHISNGTFNFNATNIQNWAVHNSNVPLSATDYTMSALVRMDMAADTTSRRLGLLLRQSLDGNGYAILITKTTSANTIQWWTTVLGVPTAALGSSTSKTFNADTWYCLKAQVSGTTLNAKFWQTTDCSSGEPGGWDVTTTNSTYTNGRIGLYTGSGTASQGMKAMFDQVSVTSGVNFSDDFTDTGTWRVVGSTQGLIGTATPGTPFTSNYINFTIKHKGGWNGVVKPEIGDKIYLSSTAIRSYKGLDSSVPITTSNSNTKYEVWDFEWDPSQNKYRVNGSASGNGSYATPGSTYTAPNNQISLRINSGSPTATKFGSRMLLLQDNLLRNNGSWNGINGIGSAVLFYPSYTLTGSPVATRYNIEGQSGTATARQRGTIDFWFKTNYSGSPSALTDSEGMYLLDYANQGNTDRLFIRHTPEGYLEVGMFASTTQSTLLRKQFSAVAGQWYHFRLAWNDSDGGPITNTKKAWLDGVAFTVGEGQNTTVGNRVANAGLIRLGNRWTYDTPFDGAIDEFAIFDEAIDTSSSCDWGNFSLPSTPWTDAQIVGCDDADSDQGKIIFLSHFDNAMNPQEGFIWADYAYGNPAMIFTNGADTGNERFRIITYPQRTRIWINNTGEKYTPSARIKHGSGHLEDAALASLRGWSHNFYFHHKAVRDSTTNPTYSPVLNLKRSIHIWSEENFTYTGATPGAPINAGLGFGGVGIGLSGLANMNISHLSMENQYSNFSIVTNPYTALTPYPSQTISKSVFYNFYERAYTVSGKTQGTNYVGAYFVTTHFSSGNIGTGYNASSSQNVGIDGSIFMGNRNQYATVPPASANGAASFFSGRLYTIKNSEFYNNGITGAGTTGALNFSAGVAKINIENNIFSINTNGVRLYGNSFVNFSSNIFDGHVSDNTTTVGSEYGSGIRAAQSYSSVFINDSGSIFGRGLWNEADINLPPNTSSFESESMLQFIGQGTVLYSPILFGTVDYQNMGRIPEAYFHTTIPGTDIRFGSGKDIVNLTTFGNMRTTGAGLSDTTVRTNDGYGWRLDPRSSDVTLDYTAKVVGVAGKPLAVTGYLRINEYYGSSSLPTVTLSGLGMSGPNLTWTAQAIPNVWQQFVVSGTPTESALAEVKISASLDGVQVADSGTSQIIANPIGNYLPPLIEDANKSWTPNQWVGYLMKDANGKIFEIVKNTDQLLYVKGIVVPHLLSTTFTAATPGNYIIFRQPMVYLDDISVLSGTVDTGTLDFHTQGQPVSPWLATGLTAEAVWSAQYSSFSDITGSFGQLLQDALIARYANVSDPSPTKTKFNTNLPTSTDDFYNDGVIIFTEGQNKGVIRRIADYGGASKSITVDPALPFTPADGDRFAILAATSSSTGSGGASAAEIWGYALRSLTTEDLEGGGRLATQADIQALNNLSAQQVWEYASRTITGGSVNLADATEVWDVACNLLTQTGSVGKKVCDNLDAAVSSRSTLTAAEVWAETTRTITGLENPALAALANSVWTNATRTLTYYGNNITAQDVWDVLTSSLTTIGSIGKMLVTNIDTTVSSRASQTSVDELALAVAALNNISAADVWNYATRTITGDVALTADSRKAIWDTACAILNTSGSVGKKVCDNLDAAVSSRSTLTAADVWGYVSRTITGLENPALAALANSVWTNATRTLTFYGNDITAQDVWDVLVSSLTTIDSIGKLLVTNVDEQISSRASQQSLDTHSQNMATTSALIDTSISSRASQSSLDAHEAAQSAFRTQTTNTLGALTTNIAAVLSQLSTIEGKIDSLASALTTIEGKIDVLGTNVSSIKTTVEDTNNRVISMQSVTDDILEKWDDYSASDIIAYIDTLETNLGNPDDDSSSNTVFGKLNYLKENGGGGGGGSEEKIDLIYNQVKDAYNKILEVQEELGYNGKSTTAYAEMLALKGYVDDVESTLSTLDSRTSSIATSLTNVSNDLKTVTDRIGKVSVDSFAQLFEVKKSDITSLQNKILELKAVVDINRQLLEKTVNQPIVKVIMEWGSVVIKFVIVNPSDSTDQKIPFKAFLPKEVKQEYIIDLGGLNLNYDTSTEQYYVTADISLRAGESVIRSVEIKDIWVISEDEIASLRKQAEDLYDGLKNTSYNAQALTLKTDINTRLDKILRKQKENNATPQDHILAYRENLEDMKAVQENLNGMKGLVLSAGAGKNFLASIGGIQAFATWGIVLALIFGMGVLGSFYYSLWRKKVVTVSINGKTKKTKTLELPTPLPHQVLNLNLAWLKKPVIGLAMLFKALFLGLGHFLVKIAILIRKPFSKIFSLPKKVILLFIFIVLLTAALTGGILVASRSLANFNKKGEKEKLQGVLPVLTPTPAEEKNELVMEKVRERLDKVKQESATALGEVAGEKSELSLTPTPTPKYKMLLIKQTPTDWLNVRQEPNTSAKILTKVYPGETYPFSEEKNGWYHILLKDLSSGWVSGEYIEVLEEKLEEQKFIEIIPPDGSGVNIRREPNKESQIIKTIYLKNKYPVLDEKEDWIKIKLLEGGYGWVAKEFTQEVKN